MSKEEAATMVEGGAPAETAPLTPAVYDRTVGKGKGPAKPGKNTTGPPVRVRVTFDEPAEFVQELEERVERIEGGVVRFMVRYDPPGEGYGARVMTLTAGAVVDGEVLELVAKAGTMWGDNGEVDQATKKRVDTWHAQLVEICGRTGLALKGGRFGAV